MDSSYRPQSPDLSSYAPQSPDLSGYNPQSPNLGAHAPPPHHGNPYAQQHPSAYGQRAHQGAFAGHHQFGGPLHHSPTSVPQHPSGAHHYPQQYIHQPGMMSPQQIKFEPQDHGMWAPPQHAKPTARTASRMKQEPMYDMHGHPAGFPPAAHQPMAIKTELPDPTLGCQLKTSFPVARIKRLMQADEDIGKVAQVTPTVVSRALELFMIKIISASAEQARGGANGGAAAASKGPKRILVQHLKKAVLANETFDFLSEIVGKVPDAPAKGSGGKKDAGSDSEAEAAAKPKKPRAKRRKESSDDF